MLHGIDTDLDPAAQCHVILMENPVKYTERTELKNTLKLQKNLGTVCVVGIPKTLNLDFLYRKIEKDYKLRICDTFCCHGAGTTLRSGVAE